MSPKRRSATPWLAAWGRYWTGICLLDSISGGLPRIIRLRSPVSDSDAMKVSRLMESEASRFRA